MTDNVAELVRRAKEGLNYDSGLRDRVGWDETIGNLVKDYERLAAENERLRAALQPLAALATHEWFMRHVGGNDIGRINFDSGIGKDEVEKAAAALQAHIEEKR